MALSNAERQKRFHQRLRARAAEGVTPDMVVKALRLIWDDALGVDEDLPSWEEYLSNCRGKRGRENWLLNLPRSKDYDEFSEFGEDAQLVRSVVAVIDAVVNPPSGP